jgi:hypothetical protein
LAALADVAFVDDAAAFEHCMVECALRGNPHTDPFAPTCEGARLSARPGMGTMLRCSVASRVRCAKTHEHVGSRPLTRPALR